MSLGLLGFFWSWQEGSVPVNVLIKTPARVDLDEVFRAPRRLDPSLVEVPVAAPAFAVETLRKPKREEDAEPFKKALVLDPGLLGVPPPAPVFQIETLRRLRRPEVIQPTVSKAVLPAALIPAPVIPAPEVFVMTDSAFIGVSGENTTTQLSPPASGSFGGGRIQDDQNPTDNVDIGNTQYREDEWCIEALGPALVGAVYEFRVLINDVVVDTTTAIPVWTIGMPDALTAKIPFPHRYHEPEEPRKRHPQLGAILIPDEVTPSFEPFRVETLRLAREQDPEEPPKPRPRISPVLVADVAPSTPAFLVETLRLARQQDPEEPPKPRRRTITTLFQAAPAVPGFLVETVRRSKRAESSDSDDSRQRRRDATPFQFPPTLIPPPDAFVVFNSANINVSGEDTTAQLTAPVSGAFGGGRIQDDQNETDVVDLSVDEYREDEWCIQATTIAVDEATYEFRLLVNGVVADTISSTPQWTIGIPALVHYLVHRRPIRHHDPVEPPKPRPRLAAVLNPGENIPAYEGIFRPRRYHEPTEPHKPRARISSTLVPDPAPAPAFLVETLRIPRVHEPVEYRKPRPVLKPPIIENPFVPGPAPPWTIELLGHWRPARLEEQMEMRYRRVAMNLRVRGTGVVDFGVVLWTGIAPAATGGKGRGGQKRRHVRGKKPNIISKMRAKDRATQEMIDFLKKYMRDNQ